MRHEGVFSQTIGLRQAAAVVFTLAGLLPLLALLLVLRRTGGLWALEVQIGLLLSLLLAVLGFVVLRRLVGQITNLAEAVTAPMAATATRPVPLVESIVPGLGRVAEISQLSAAFARMLEDLRASTDRLQDLVFKLSALNELVELASRIPKMQDLLSLVLERSMRMVRATCGSIMLLDAAQRALRVVAVRGPGREDTGGTEVALEAGVAGRVARLGEPAIAGDTLCLPIRIEDRIIGVVELTRSAADADERVFSPTDLQLLNTLLVHVAYALDNARLLEEAQRSAARLGRALEDLQTAQSRVVEGERLRAMGQMASGMAHHLNNLLSVVSGRNQLLLLRVQEPEIRAPLEVIQRATLDAAEVVRRVLGFTAVQPVVQTARVDLNDLLRDVIELTRPRWRDQAQVRGVAIELVPHLAPAAEVVGEAAPLREVIMNLLLNAVDALPQGGTITLTTGTSGGRVVVTVADTGTGMTDDVRRRALEPFFTTKGPHNTGLGLALTHGIVQRHGGELEIESAPGRGTRITVRLPEAAGGPTVAAPPAPAPASAPLRILLLDDEASVRRALADALTVLGHTVVEAAGGREGLERLERGLRVDVVISDLGMPGMTGWEVASEVRMRWPDLPVGLVTGWASQSEPSPEEVRRVAFVIAKPYTLDALGAALAPIRPR